MTKKFTEEEYKEIVYMFSVAGDSEEETRLVAEYVSSINHSSDYYKALALANPLTREWAHDKFVEKEKKYYWIRNDLFLTQFDTDDSLYFDEKQNAKALTESEIKAWGFNQEMFEKEEVLD